MARKSKKSKVSSEFEARYKLLDKQSKLLQRKENLLWTLMLFKVFLYLAIGFGVASAAVYFLKIENGWLQIAVVLGCMLVAFYFAIKFLGLINKD